MKHSLYEDDDCILRRGRFSVTYRMKNISNNIIYTVEILDNEQVISNIILIEKIVNEIKSLYQLKHPNIIRYFASFLNADKSKLYIVKELINGKTLSLIDNMTKSTPIDTVTVIEWSKQILYALTYLHDEAKIQHQDLKPENILLNSANDSSSDCDTTIILIGLGLGSASLINQNQNPTVDPTPNQSQSQKGVDIGTYYSYEKAQGMVAC
mgnify:CR=1 FL=1